MTMEAPRAPRKAALLCGGPSAEFVVSLTSARNVAHAIDRKRYSIRVFCIQEDGSWICPEETWDSSTYPSRVEKLFDLLDMPEFCPNGYFSIRPPAEGVRRLAGWQPDIVLPVMHGAFGEDGRIQGMLDVLGIPYIGSGVGASALAIDKRRTIGFVSAHGVKAPRHILLRSAVPRRHRDEQLAGAGELLGWPIVCKPTTAGSSVAASLAHNPEELYRGVTRAFEIADEVMLEQFIKGREATCSVLDLAESYGGRQVCPPTEIRTKEHFFTFDSKYRPGAAEEITPAPMDEPVISRIQAMAEKAHDLIGCRGLSRTDVIVTDEGYPVFLEINTMPGMTSTSLLPQQTLHLGMDLTLLLSGLIEGVFENLVEKKAREY